MRATAKAKGCSGVKPAVGASTPTCTRQGTSNTWARWAGLSPAKVLPPMEERRLDVVSVRQRSSFGSTAGVGHGVPLDQERPARSAWRLVRLATGTEISETARTVVVMSW